MTVPAGLYPLDESDRIVAERVVFFLAADWTTDHDPGEWTGAAAPMDFGQGEAAARLG